MLNKVTARSGSKHSLNVALTDGRTGILAPTLMPVRQTDDKLLALELLSRIHFSDKSEVLSAETLLHCCPLTEQLSFFCWQLDVIQELLPWCKARGLLLSVNIPRSIGISLLSARDIIIRMQEMDQVLRLELNEYFISPESVPGQDPVIQAMAILTPLWLDDLGAGASGFCWMMAGIFEMVKLNQHLFGRLTVQPHGQEYLQALNLLVSDAGTRMIADGVADETTRHFVEEAGVSACQGWLWPAVAIHELDDIPLQISAA